tara:strand:- start:1153 stop:2103 length:951 start_codon:yes stop_codon:yes gene_type:complete
MPSLRILWTIKLLLIFAVTANASDGEFKINVNSPISMAAMLSGDMGKSIDISLNFEQTEAIQSRGLAVILPSSTPDMEDEFYYAKQMQLMGFSTVIVDGAKPRFAKKFTRSYTSAMIAQDLAKALEFTDEKFRKPKKVVVLASSTGSLAILASQLLPVINAMPSLGLITHIFMLNAACPAKVVPALSQNADIFTVNGLQDDSTPAFACQEMKEKNDMPNVEMLIYEGAHHFESPKYTNLEKANAPHIIPTCRINYDQDVFMYVEKRDGLTGISEKDVGMINLQKWVYKNCVKRGNLQGYNEKSARMFWSDVKRLTQ